MKALITFLTIFCCTISVFAQDDKLEETIKKQLDFKDADYFSFEVKKLHDNTDFSVATIGKYSNQHKEEDDGFECDLILVLFDNKTSKIIDKYVESNAYISDAIALTDLNLDLANYKINDYTRAFGVRVSFKNNSRPNPVGDNNFSLFAIRKNKIIKILDEIRLDEWFGESDMKCNYDGEETNSIIKMKKEKTNDHFDFEVITTKTVRKGRPSKSNPDDCIETNKKQKPTVNTYVFVNGKYQLKVLKHH